MFSLPLSVLDDHSGQVRDGMRSLSKIKFQMFSVDSSTRSFQSPTQQFQSLLVDSALMDGSGLELNAVYVSVVDFHANDNGTPVKLPWLLTDDQSLTSDSIVQSFSSESIVQSFTSESIVQSLERDSIDTLSILQNTVVDSAKYQVPQPLLLSPAPIKKLILSFDPTQQQQPQSHRQTFNTSPVPTTSARRKILSITRLKLARLQIQTPQLFSSSTASSVKSTLLENDSSSTTTPNALLMPMALPSASLCSSSSVEALFTPIPHINLPPSISSSSPFSVPPPFTFQSFLPRNEGDAGGADSTHESNSLFPFTHPVSRFSPIFSSPLSASLDVQMPSKNCSLSPAHGLAPPSTHPLRSLTGHRSSFTSAQSSHVNGDMVVGSFVGGYEVFILITIKM